MNILPDFPFEPRSRVGENIKIKNRGKKGIFDPNSELYMKNPDKWGKGK